MGGFVGGGDRSALTAMRWVPYVPLFACLAGGAFPSPGMLNGCGIRSGDSFLCPQR